MKSEDLDVSRCLFLLLGACCWADPIILYHIPHRLVDVWGLDILHGWIMRIKWHSTSSNPLLRSQCPKLLLLPYYQTCFFLASWGVTGVLHMFPFLLCAFSRFSPQKKTQIFATMAGVNPLRLSASGRRSREIQWTWGISKLFRGS